MPTTPPNPESILIVRLGAMGDVLHAMPSVAALRNTLPGVGLGWAIERRWAELLMSSEGGTATSSRHNLVDSVHVVDTHGWRKHPFRTSTINEVRSALGSLRSQQYTIAIDIQGASKSALIAKFSQARSVYGFASPREHLATIFYSTKVKAHAAHVVDQNFELCSEAVHQPLTASEFDLPRLAAAEQWCETNLREIASNKFAILNPGSGWGAKCWPPERFAEVARRLSASGIASIVNYAPSEEKLAYSLAKLSGGTARPIFATIPHLIALTRRASLFIGGDTGPLHLAATLRIPVVALFGPTDPARNGPYGTRSITLRSERSVTSYSHVAAPDPGLQSITADDVVSAAAQLLGVTIG